MAGTTRGAIKGWITRRRNMGITIPEFANDDEALEWAESQGYQGRGSARWRATQAKLKADLDALPEVDATVSTTSLKARQAAVEAQMREDEKAREPDEPLFRRPLPMVPLAHGSPPVFVVGAGRIRGSSGPIECLLRPPRRWGVHGRVQ